MYTFNIGPLCMRHLLQAYAQFLPGVVTGSRKIITKKSTVLHIGVYQAIYASKQLELWRFEYVYLDTAKKITWAEFSAASWTVFAPIRVQYVMHTQ